jgi:peptidoglycan/xylan/chitin deacetylase (PgdA/CDA1 family)
MRRLREAARRLKDRFASRALILMYHRVTELANDPYLLAVTPKHFAEQLEVIRRYGAPIRLRQLVEALQDGKVPKRGVVVTFDDGYADNLYSAKPLLERYDIPATVFVTTGHVGHPCEFWWDELDRLLLQPGTLPSRLELSLDGHAWQWELGEAATYTTADYQRDCNWHIEREDSPTPRHRLHRSLYKLLHNLTATHKRQLLDDLRIWASAQPIGRSTHRTLAVNELAHLAEQQLIEIGAHTVTHPVLGTLPVATQRDEILQSRTRIEELVGRSVLSFAYPHGSYTQDTLAVVRDAGFSFACSSDTAAVRTDSDPFRLPRISMRNWDGESFSRCLVGRLGE